MGDIQAKFGAASTITVTIASLTANSANQSNAVDNSSNLFLDALVLLKVKSGGSGTAATGVVNVYALASVDDGTTYTEGGTGSSGSITLTAPPNARLIGVVNVVANSTTYEGGPFSVAAAFGGVLPKFWAIVIENKSGGTLDSTAGNHACQWQGVLAQAA